MWSSFAPISNVIDTIGRECLNTGENLYIYKNCVSIPPLAFVDDLFLMSECGTKSLIANAFVNTKIEMKNLEFGVDNEKNEAKKCRQIHICKENTFCPPLKAHQANIPKVDDEKYLGDIISADGKLSKTIQQRKAKATGKISEITTILKNVSLGSHYFTIAVIISYTLYILSRSEPN